MITKTDAEAIVCDLLKKLESPDLPFAIIESETIERAFGWVFFYNSRKCIETGDFRYTLAGNGPIIVNSHNGAIAQGRSSQSVEAFIEGYERDLESVVCDAPGELKRWFSKLDPGGAHSGIGAELVLPEKEQRLNKACVTLEHQEFLGSMTAWGTGAFDFIVVNGAIGKDVLVRNTTFSTAQELESLLNSSLAAFLRQRS